MGVDFLQPSKIFRIHKTGQDLVGAKIVGDNLLRDEIFVFPEERTIKDPIWDFKLNGVFLKYLFKLI